jgi:hypothetical protein
VVRGGGGSRCFVFEVDVVYCYSILNMVGVRRRSYIIT